LVDHARAGTIIFPLPVSHTDNANPASEQGA
jgi:hypothetical protein